MHFILRYFIFFFLMTTTTFLTACNDQSGESCHPLLFPHVEYGYKAEPQKLPGLYSQQNDDEIIKFHGIRLAIPDGWHHEIVLSGHSAKFIKKDIGFFLLSYEKNMNIESSDTTNFRFIGCDHFKVDKNSITKTSKDFYTDLFSFTDDEIDSDSGFWHYYILWAKIDMFHDSKKLVNYRGNSLEAFQNNIKSRFCECKTFHTRITIFPEKIAPNFLTIVANDIEDPFFKGFLDMIDKLNH